MALRPADVVAAVLLAGVLGLTACRAPPSGADLDPTHGSGPGAPAERELTLVLIKTGPTSATLPEAERKQAFAGHFANMGRLAEARQLVLAGPFGPARHDPLLRGLFVLDTSDPATARDWAGTDPTTQAGVFTLEYHALTTDAPLRALLERELAIAAQAQAEGRERAPGEGARSYVLLTADDGERARPVLEELAERGLVLLLARLDGTRALAILDASDSAAAESALTEVADRLGPHALDDWFATGELVNLASLRD